MTKARDLANAASVLNAVSPTELTYLDGVTSPIQTQITQINNAIQDTTVADAMDSL